jgi:hypothetical protein
VTQFSSFPSAQGGMKIKRSSQPTAVNLGWAFNTDYASDRQPRLSPATKD